MSLLTAINEVCATTLKNNGSPRSQWRIQDFPELGGQLSSCCYFAIFYAKTCRESLAPPLGSAPEDERTLSTATGVGAGAILQVEVKDCSWPTGGVVYRHPCVVTVPAHTVPKTVHNTHTILAHTVPKTVHNTHTILAHTVDLPKTRRYPRGIQILVSIYLLWAQFAEVAGGWYSGQVRTEKS